MDLQTRKIEFIQEFLKLQSEDVVTRFEKMLLREKNKSVEEGLQPFSMQEFKERIDKSMDDSKNGRLIKADALKAKMDEWN